MPPKKKVKEKKKKKKSDAADEQSIDEKYRLTLHKIESLQDHLVLRTEIARRSEATSRTLRDQVSAVNTSIEEEKQHKHDISSNLIRQYKTMQEELRSRIHQLETKVTLFQEKLLNTECELKKEKDEKAKIIKEKSETIAGLEYKIELMESAYENVIHDAFDMMSEKLEKSKLSWQAEASKIQEGHKKLLLEFGLNPLDI